MKISIKNLESSALQLTVDGTVSTLAAGDSRDVDFSGSLSVTSPNGTIKSYGPGVSYVSPDAPSSESSTLVAHHASNPVSVPTGRGGF